MYDAFGVPAVTTAQMEDFAQVMRKLWHGEVVLDHDGPIGKYPVLFLDSDFDEDIRLGGWWPSARRRWRWAGGRSTTSSCTPTSRRRPCNAA